MKRDNEKIYEIDVQRLLRALWRRAWLIVLVGVLAAGAAFGYARYIVPPKYRANVLMYVNNANNAVGAGTSISSGQLLAAQNLVSTYVVILESQNTLQAIIDKAGLQCDHKELLGMIDAQAVNGTEIFRVDVTGYHPEECAIIANTIADILPERIGDVVEGSSVRVVNRAVIPKIKASPSIPRYTVIGLLLGVLLTAAVILLRELADDVIHDEDYLIQNYSLPILSKIPDLMDGHTPLEYGRNKASDMKRKGGETA